MERIERWLESITHSMDMNQSKLGETVKDRRARCAAVHGVTVGHDLVTEQQQQSLQTRSLCLSLLILLAFSLHCHQSDHKHKSNHCYISFLLLL